MATIHPYKQRRLIEQPGVGESVLWSKGYRADHESPAHNHVNRATTLSDDLGEDFVNGHIYELQSHEAPVTAFVAAPAGLGTGALPLRTYSYAMTYVTRYGETDLGAATQVTLAAATNSKVALANLPLAVPIGILSRRLYRAVIGPYGVGEYRLVAQLGRTESTYLDNKAPAQLGVNPPKRNTTQPVVLIHGFKTTMETVTDNGPTLLKVGNARVTFMPADIPLARPDRLVLLSEARRETGREVLQRRIDSLDPLSFTPASEIVRVFQRDNRVADYEVGVDCRLDASGRFLEWLSNGPPAGEFYSVEYLYRPTVWFLNEEASNAHPSAFGEGLARSGRVVMQHPTSLEAAAP